MLGSLPARARSLKINLCIVCSQTNEKKASIAAKLVANVIIASNSLTVSSIKWSNIRCISHRFDLIVSKNSQLDSTPSIRGFFGFFSQCAFDFASKTTVSVQIYLKLNFSNCFSDFFFLSNVFAYQHKRTVLTIIYPNQKKN